MTILTPADIAEGALRRGTPAFNKHFPKLPEQHPPALIPGPPKQVAKPSDVESDVPLAPPMDDLPSTSAIVPTALITRPSPLAPLMMKPNASSASSSAPVVEQALPKLKVEAVFEEAICRKATAEDLNALAIQVAREIRTKDDSQWAPLLTRCTKALANCARMTSEGQAVTWNSQRGGSEGILTKEIQKVIMARPTDGEAGRRQLATLFAFVIGEQVFNEGNNRGAYFLAAMLGEFHKIALPAQEKFMKRDKDKSGFFKKRISDQFMAMYD